jgi:H+/Cl- antiporter ClcA
VKAAFWRDFGYLPFRVVLAKFFGCVITIGGGSSLGREGPTVHIAGALASNVASLLGAPNQERRPALLADAAAGLAAAFNTPLSAHFRTRRDHGGPEQHSLSGAGFGRLSNFHVRGSSLSGG